MSRKLDSDGNPYPPTTSSKRYKDEEGFTWTQYSGTKESHDVYAQQFNSKTYDGQHTFYSPSSGKSGGAHDERHNYDNGDK